MPLSGQHMALPTRNVGQEVPSLPTSAAYFYGRITRDEAELILKKRGKEDGLFLLRESITPMGNYAISVCYAHDIHHYILEKQSNGTYQIPEGKAFPGPLELIKHYQGQNYGFVTLPSKPCERGPHEQPLAFRGITYQQLEKALAKEARKMHKDVRQTRQLGQLRDQLMMHVAHSLHSDMPWWHGRLSRQAADARLKRDGPVDGKFLVREREGSTYAITMTKRHRYHHFLIRKNPDTNCLAIEDGPEFENLMILIDNYHNKSDGLPCKLRLPCCRPGYSSHDLEEYMGNNYMGFRQKTPRPAEPGAGGGKRNEARRSTVPLPSVPTFRALGSSMDAMEDSYQYEEVDHPDVELDMNAEDLEDVYGCDKLRREVTTRKLRPDQLFIDDFELGQGNFGSVKKGFCRLEDTEIPVAIKVLKNTDMGRAIQSELMEEAEVMKKLNHKHIVRMIGVCEGEMLMLVLELAKLGPLNKFLQRHPHLPLWHILELMTQVACGMEYLEACGYVHRDLAARNILLCDPHFAKISDFGMSRILDSNYYEAREQGRWPLKWYDLVCIDYWKFDSKSDVWSFGITLWEAVTHGGKPYERMKGNELVEFLRCGLRLSKPDTCTESVYEIMLSCWSESREARPSFKELVPIMKSTCKDHKMFDMA